LRERGIEMGQSAQIMIVLELEPGSYNVAPYECWRETMFIELKSLARGLILPPASLSFWRSSGCY